MKGMSVFLIVFTVHTLPSFFDDAHFSWYSCISSFRCASFMVVRSRLSEFCRRAFTTARSACSRTNCVVSWLIFCSCKATMFCINLYSVLYASYTSTTEEIEKSQFTAKVSNQSLVKFSFYLTTTPFFTLFFVFLEVSCCCHFFEFLQFHIAFICSDLSIFKLRI